MVGPKSFVVDDLDLTVVGQPFIKTLSLKCRSTGKKSDTVDNTPASDLFFMTNRNIHKDNAYTSEKFLKRQTILLRSEDVGTMKIDPSLYQREKRAHYVISGNLSNTLRTVHI